MFGFKKGFHVSRAGFEITMNLELLVLLPLPAECWDYRHVSYPVYVVLEIKSRAFWMPTLSSSR